MRTAANIFLGLVALFFLFSFCVPLEETKETAKRYACLSRVKQQATAFLIYVEDNGQYPPRDFWRDRIDKYLVDKPLRCPNMPEGTYGYAFNSTLAGLKEPKSPELVALVFDSANPIRNASDAVTSLPHPGRHEGKNNIGYADGHARAAAQR